MRGHVVAVAHGGQLLAAAGDPCAVTPLRSCLKPVQAIPFTRWAADEVGAAEDEVAIACASHHGEPVHVTTVLRLLARCGLKEDDLSCGAHLPYDPSAARTLVASGLPPRRVHNNCSGKHAAMLATCVTRGWPVQGYARPGHPLQREIRRILGELAGEDVESAPWGVDGCGLPTPGLPVSALARALGAAAGDAAGSRNLRAMARHPLLVAGSTGFDSRLLAAAGDTLTVKGGGAAVWAAVHRTARSAVVIKFEAGDGQAMSAVATAVLGALGWLRGPAGAALAADRRPVLRNWAGETVGDVLVTEEWLEPFLSAAAA